MSQRDKSRTKAPPAKKSVSRPAKTEAAVPPRDPAIAALEERVKALEAERSTLTAQLSEARARIAKLEAARTQVVNRIDWVIDSLKGLVEGEG